MTPLTVVEHLDVVKDIAPGLMPCGVYLFADALALEQLEEAFSYGVVVAVAASAHACLQTVALQEALPGLAGKLTALLRVDQHCVVWGSAPNGHQQCVQHQLRINAAAHGPTHDMPGEQVQNYR